MTLAETLIARAKNPFKRAQRETFWALNDVSFDITKGDVVGVIGRNGAGKSTLLKILSRITEPTTGEIEIRGRIGSLLEVGTGFHPELTGRENVFLNGAILGMSKGEIKKQFDAIVEFSGVEKFLDTPVKRYSSGMYVRLAFAVAAHLRTEILIVDEVLSVGDAEFQKKCLGKMKDVASGGRTVLFVSHNMAAVELLCDRGLFLGSGRVVVHDQAHVVLAEYLNAQTASHSLKLPTKKPPGSHVWIRRVWASDETGNHRGEFPFNFPIRLNLEVEVDRPIYTLQIGVRLSTQGGVPVATFTDSDDCEALSRSREPGVYEITITLPSGVLLPNAYSVLVAAHIPGQVLLHQIEDAVTFSISAVGCRRALDSRQGIVALQCAWSERSCSTAVHQ